MELILFIGLQGAGKSTFYRERFAGTHAHVSKDNFPHNRNRDRRQRQLIEEAFAMGQSVVVDNTNLTRESRAPLVRLAHSNFVPAIAYYFDEDFQSCFERNQKREGKARVPDVGLFASRAKLQPPSWDEGFDEIGAVTLGPEGFTATRMLNE